MNTARSGTFARLDLWESSWCVRINAFADNAAARNYFAIVSRLGDGIAWYLLLLLLPVFGGTVLLPVVARMALTALAGIALYRLLKDRLTRERPYASVDLVRAVVPPLDRYSFPSGHTLHAAAFTVMISHDVPVLLPLVVPFAASVAASRVVLGLHYPTDVLAGAALGSLLAWAGILLLPF
jgi:undecaprenyl-diphosphatase